MPEVFATGFMVALMEWTCVQALAPASRRRARAASASMSMSRMMPRRPPGMTVTVDVEATEVDGRKVWFFVRAHDGVDQIGEGYHQRAIVDWDRFKARVAAKQAKAAG